MKRQPSLNLHKQLKTLPCTLLIIGINCGYPFKTISKTSSNPSFRPLLHLVYKNLKTENENDNKFMFVVVGVELSTAKYKYVFFSSHKRWNRDQKHAVLQWWIQK